MAAHVGGGGDKPSALPAWKRNSLETTLHKRIEEVASGRKPQKKEGGEEGKAATAAGGKGKKKK